MKKLMWIVSVIPLLFTAVALQFMPDTIPMHSNLAGEIDRWGSKYESYIFPLLILAITLFWHLLPDTLKKSRPGKIRQRAGGSTVQRKIPADCRLIHGSDVYRHAGIYPVRFLSDSRHRQHRCLCRYCQGFLYHTGRHLHCSGKFHAQDPEKLSFGCAYFLQYV